MKKTTNKPTKKNSNLEYIEWNVSRELIFICLVSFGKCLCGLLIKYNYRQITIVSKGLISSIMIFKDRFWWIILALNGTRVSFLPQFDSDRRVLLYWNKLTCRNISNKLANRNNRKQLWLECFFNIWYQDQCLFMIY